MTKNIKLMFTDTDILCYEIKTDDVYKEKKIFDNSNYPKNSEIFFFFFFLMKIRK